MKKLIGTIALVALTATVHATDTRLSTAKTVYVTSGNSTDARQVAACVADQLPNETPLIIVDKSEADIVLTVTKAHVPGGVSGVVFHGQNHPSATLTASLPDGTVIWTVIANRYTIGAACSRLATVLIKSLRDAVHHSIDAKKW